MKTVLTILFFADTMLVSLLSYLLLKLLDTKGHAGLLGCLFFVYAGCIFLLGYLLFRYVNLPPDQKSNSFFE